MKSSGENGLICGLATAKPCKVDFSETGEGVVQVTCVVAAWRRGLFQKAGRVGDSFLDECMGSTLEEGN